MVNTKLFILFLFVMGLVTGVRAQMLEIPIDELPSESVIPALDSPRAVQDRALTYSKRWNMEVSTAWLMDEPFYGNTSLGLRALYHFSETSGLGLRYINWLGGTSDYAKQFNALNFGYSRGPSRGYAISFESRFIYGKVSFSKNTVLPISTMGQYEAGMIQYGSRNLPFLSVGIGNNLFFNKNWGMNLVVKLMMRQMVDPLSQSLRTPTAPNPEPQETDFTTKTRLGTGLDVGAIYLF